MGMSNLDLDDDDLELNDDYYDDYYGEESKITTNSSRIFETKTR